MLQLPKSGRFGKSRKLNSEKEFLAFAKSHKSLFPKELKKKYNGRFDQLSKRKQNNVKKLFAEFREKYQVGKDESFILQRSKNKTEIFSNPDFTSPFKDTDGKIRYISDTNIISERYTVSKEDMNAIVKSNINIKKFIAEVKRNLPKNAKSYFIELGKAGTLYEKGGSYDSRNILLRKLASVLKSFSDYHKKDKKELFKITIVATIGVF